MAAQHAEAEVKDAIDKKQPGKEEMPAASSREILKRRYGSPCRESPRRRLAFDVRNSENTGRRKLHAGDTHETARFASLSLGADRQDSRVAVCAIMAPIKLR